MTPNFERTVTVRCSACNDPIVRKIGTVMSAVRSGKLIFCTGCWPARKRELDRNYRARRR